LANNRKIFIINPKFQLKLSLIICGLVLLGSVIYPKTIYDLFEKIIAIQPELAERYIESRQNLLNVLFLIEGAFLGLAFLIGIFISHRIAGPMYKMQNYLINYRAGDIDHPLNFRDGDNFQEVADELNLTIDHLNNRTDDEIDYLEEVCAYMDNISLVVPQDKKPVLAEIKMKLSLIIERSKITP
jgi:signal transduction histidine kinase